MPKDNRVVAVDVGTSKISCVIAEYSLENGIEIIGKGYVPSHGVKMGIVTDLQECSKAIELAIIDAENSAGTRVSHVFAGISGEHITSGYNKGKIDITNKNNEITPSDLRKVIHKAGGVKLSQDRKILDIIPRGFYINGHNGIVNPVGMRAQQLEVDAYIVTGSNTYLQNISRAFEMTEIVELEKNGFIHSSLAAAKAIIRDEEKKLGTLFVDIGAGTTKIAAFKNGSLIHCRTLPVAGDRITFDIAMHRKIPLSEAEGLKVSKGCSCVEMLTEEEGDEIIEALSFSESESIDIERRILVEVIELRLIQIFKHIKKEIQMLNDRGVYFAGVILTGGTAKLKGISYLAARVLELPVKIGKPVNIRGLNEWEGNPEFSGVVGTAAMALERRSEKSYSVKNQNFVQRVMHVLKKIWDYVIAAF